MTPTPTDAAQMDKCVCGHEAEAHCLEWAGSGPAKDTKYGLGSCGWVDDATKSFCTCEAYTKEGPPTPLECWKALKRVSEAWKTGTHAPMQMIVDHIEVKMLKRFSSEALERDEKRVAQDSRRMAALEEYANSYDDLQDALLVFVTQRKTPGDSAYGYTQAPVQEALQKADQIRAKLYKIQGRTLNVSDRLDSLRSKLDALTPAPKEGPQ